MNNIRQIQSLNQRELDNAVSPEASWHADYRDTAYIYIGGLPFDLTEGDILTIFSQFGEPVHLNLVRDKDTGKSRGFAFLKYENQRSTDLAVDNLSGATVMGRLLRVDHTRYKRREEEGLEDNLAALEAGEETAPREKDRTKRRAKGRGPESDNDEEEREKQRPLLKEEKELARLMEEHDEEDPMKEFLVQEKKEEVEKALEKSRSTKHRGDSKERHGSRRPRHRHHHRRPRRTSEDRSGSGDRRSPRKRSRSRSKERRPHRERRERTR